MLRQSDFFGRYLVLRLFSHERPFLPAVLFVVSIPCGKQIEHPPCSSEFSSRESLMLLIFCGVSGSPSAVDPKRFLGSLTAFDTHVKTPSITFCILGLIHRGDEWTFVVPNFLYATCEQARDSHDCHSINGWAICKR